MDVVLIFNGLGNQMSQYSFYLQKKVYDKNTIFILDKKSRKEHNGFELTSVFGIPYNNTLKKQFLYYIFRILEIQRFSIVLNPIKKVLKYLNFQLSSEAENYEFDQKKLTCSTQSVRFLRGGWHSEKYFLGLKKELHESFRFKDTDDERLNEYLEQIENSESISIHVRRGDYVSTEFNFKMYGCVCSLNYYNKAIAEIKKTIDNPKFFVFSNDIDWVNDNAIFKGMTIVRGFSGKDSWKDMYLISKCKHNINSNSTFSWWSAWLNKNPMKIVIVPYYFINNLETKDFYPENWIKLRNY